MWEIQKGEAIWSLKMSSSAVPPCSLSTAIHPLLQRSSLCVLRLCWMGFSKMTAWLASGGVTAHSMVQILMAILHEACMITFVGECFDFSCKSLERMEDLIRSCYSKPRLWATAVVTGWISEENSQQFCTSLSLCPFCWLALCVWTVQNLKRSPMKEKSTSFVFL